MRMSLSVLSALLSALVSALPVGAQERMWLVQHGSEWNESVTTLVEDGAGGTFGAGWTIGAFGGPNQGQMDAWLARFTVAGDIAWIRQFGTSQNDGVDGLVPDGAGGVFAGGTTRGALGGANAGSDDVWLARFDSVGNQLWLVQFGTSASDFLRSLASDGAGGCFASGFSGGALGGPNEGGIDAWIGRFSRDGEPIWIRQFGTPGHDEASTIAHDGSGGVLIGGWTTGSLGGPIQGDRDAWLSRYDSDGNRLWIEQLGTPQWEECRGVTSDGRGGAYFGGSTNGALGGGGPSGPSAWITRYSGDGSQLWLVQFNDGISTHLISMTSDDGGGILAGGSTLDDLFGQNQGESDAWIAQFDAAGNRLWGAQFGSQNREETTGALALTSSQAVFAGSTSGLLGKRSYGGQDIWLAHYTIYPSTRLLRAQATCPSGGPIRIEWSGATPGGQVALIFARNTGSFIIPNNVPCAGTQLGLGSNQIQLAWQGGAGANGSRVLNTTAGPAACGGHLQLLDLTPCAASNVARIE